MWPSHIINNLLFHTNLTHINRKQMMATDALQTSKWLYAWEYNTTKLNLIKSISFLINLATTWDIMAKWCQYGYSASRKVMSWPCLDHVLTMSWPCLDHVLTMSLPCLDHVLTMSWPCLDHVFCLCSTMNYKHTCLIFGITPSVCSPILSNMTSLSIGCLHFNDSAKVKFPSPEKMQQFMSMINCPEPMISDVVGFMDDISFQLECMSESVTQNAFYCAYDCETIVNKCSLVNHAL